MNVQFHTKIELSGNIPTLSDSSVQLTVGTRRLFVRARKHLHDPYYHGSQLYEFSADAQLIYLFDGNETVTSDILGHPAPDISYMVEALKWLMEEE